MKNTILGLLVVTVLLVAPMATSAQTLDVQSQINALLAQIKVLQQQLADLIKQQTASIPKPPSLIPPTAGPSKARICSLVLRNIGVGARGDDVSALQDFLNGQGFFSESATGFFGSITSQALMRWQASQGLEGVGNLGPLSRERILKWCGTGEVNEWKLRASPHKGEAPLAVTFGANVTLANSSMVADAGDYKIVFGDGEEHIFTCTDVSGMCKGPHTIQHTYDSNGTYIAELIHYGYYGAPNPDGSISSSRSMGKITITVGGPVACTMEYAPVCGSKPVVCITYPCNPVQQTYSNKCAMNADGATYVHSGECRPVNEAKFDVSPIEGAAPLEVSFSTWISGFRVPSTYFTIDFGDGTSERAAHCLAPADACISPGVNKHTYQKAGTYKATLNRVVDPCYGQTACRAAVHSEVVAKSTVIVKGPVACTKEYRPVCGEIQIQCITTPCDPIRETYSNLCMMSAAGAKYVHEGACQNNNYPNPADDPRCKSWYDGCNSCSRESAGSPAMCTLRACLGDQMGKAYCSAYFDKSCPTLPPPAPCPAGTNASWNYDNNGCKVSSQCVSAGNKPPVVSGISGPTTLAVGATGTWLVNASDPERGQLTYKVMWGDEYSMPFAPGMSALYTDAFYQTSTFTHSYSAAGTYTIKVVVKDSAGQSAQTSTTVKVGSDIPPVACTMEYVPVCGQPKPGVCNDTPISNPMSANSMCAYPQPQTYGNRCVMNAAGATLLYMGECRSGGGNQTICPADARMCPDGSYVGRSGPDCQFVCSSGVLN